MACWTSVTLVSVLMLAVLFPSEALVCKRYPISDMSCPTMDDCVDRCHNLGYPIGICLTISDELICMCSICTAETVKVGRRMVQAPALAPVVEQLGL